MPDAKPSLFQTILACVAGRDRTPVIFGDLLELSGRRGRLWFWGAYARTLLVFAWRPVTAFVSGLVSLRAIFWLLFQALHAPSMQSVPKSPSTLLFAFIVAGTAAPLWFALPYMLIRFGSSDRLIKLACALFLSTLPGFSIALPHFSVPLLDGAGLTTLILLAGALSSTAWRAAGLTLLATVGTGIGSLIVFFRILDEAYNLAGRLYPHQNNFSIRLLFDEFTASLAMLLVAAVCSRVHNTLFRLRIEDAHA